MASQTTQEERYIHCTRTQCTDALPAERGKGIICPIDQRYHQFRQKCIYNRTYSEMGLTPAQTSAKCTEPIVIDFQAAREARERVERAKQYEEIGHLADHLFPKK